MPYTSSVRGASASLFILDKPAVSHTQELQDVHAIDVPTTSDNFRPTRDRQRDKRCIKCKRWLEKAIYFGVHNTSSDGYQSICKDCKKLMNKVSLSKNVNMRLRHHTATRCLAQLGDKAPRGFTKALEHYLGYSIKVLVRHLRRELKSREGEQRSLKDALNEGYHIDHKMPLSSFNVVLPDNTIDWEEFRRCWAVENLMAIPAKENLQKGAKIIDFSRVEDISEPK